MSRRGLITAFAAMFVVALVATFPMSVALKAMGAASRGLAAERVSGSVWSGHLDKAQFRGLEVGDVALRLDPLGLLMGGGRLRFELRGPLQGRGVLHMRGTEAGVSGVKLSGPATALAANLPFRGTLRLEGVEGRFRSGVCRRARGRVIIESLSLGGGVALPGLVLSGTAACRGNSFTAPLSGRAAGVDVEAELQVDGQGRYRLQSRVRTTNPTLEAAMGLAGFERRLDGFNRLDQGVLGDYAAR